MNCGILFFLSGFAGLLYQIVWLRWAFSHFGILTPVLSTVVSVFMLGLGAGAWAAGRWIERRKALPPGTWLRTYGYLELFVGIWALSVPAWYRAGETMLWHAGQMSAAGYWSGSALAITMALLPPCLAMGMTFPVMMAHARQAWKDSANSFSYLYRANVLGALSGALLTPVVFIETFGFRRTNWIGVVADFTVAVLSIRWAASAALSVPESLEASTDSSAAPMSDSSLLFPLFLTGFVSLGCEVMWTRMFTPVLGSTIYAFAAVLAVYLAASWAGTSLYRHDLSRGKTQSFSVLYGALGFTACLPAILNDPRISLGWISAVISLVPFCGLLGYITPQLVDLYAGGDSRAAGRAYAINVAGCVLGPLAACYLLLPYGGTKSGIFVMALMLFALLLRRPADFRVALVSWGLFLEGLCVIIAGMRFCSAPEEFVPVNRAAVVVHRDYAATVLSYGEGFGKRLRVNGVGITYLTPVTKAMAHLPIFLHTGKPERALVICFGMGTTYRSLLSWGLRTTAVELVPGVRDAFDYYFSDAAEVLRNPLGEVVVDDGRRYLQRTTETYDIITLDPPPPVEAAGSGLLYSPEFYRLIKARLRPGGVLQQWWPGGEIRILNAASQSIRDSFPYVRVYRSLEGQGYHFLASMTPMGRPTLEECVRRMPPLARQDLLEWGGNWTLPRLVAPFIAHEIPIEDLLDDVHPVAITDDQPFNEYYLLRRMRKL